MTITELPSPALKQLLKEALAETLVEQRDLLHDSFAEVLEAAVIEDVALAESIREGQDTEPVSRDAIFQVLESGGGRRSSARALSGT